MATTAKTSTTKRTSTKRTKISASHTTGEKKRALVKSKRSTGEGAACWPGFERVPGTTAGSKGSCKPKAHQTSGEKKADARAAAGSKLEKAGGSKKRANASR